MMRHAFYEEIAVAKARGLVRVVWVGVVVLAGGVGSAQGQAAGTAASKKTCTVDSSAPTSAETALNKGDFVPAEKLFREVLAKSPSSEEMHEGLVRALIGEDRVDDAVKDAEAWVAASPASSMAMVAFGDVRLRQGNPRAALIEFQMALQGDLCNARARYGVAEVDDLAGLHASAKGQIETAYQLHPTDDSINMSWIGSRQRKERLEKLSDYAQHSDQISEENRAKLKTELEKQSLYHAFDCRMAPTSPREATVPMVAVMDGPYSFLSWGVGCAIQWQAAAIGD
jgi:Tfp pilus assembly protein PilF